MGKERRSSTDSRFAHWIDLAIEIDERLHFAILHARFAMRIGMRDVAASKMRPSARLH
ncbi:MAG: hypothetical protein ABL956_17620 [Hyphomonadaceae bacterium]